MSLRDLLSVHIRGRETPRIKLTISRLIYDFDLELVDLEKNWFEQQIWGFYDKKPLMLHVRDRKQSNSKVELFGL